MIYQDIDIGTKYKSQLQLKTIKNSEIDADAMSPTVSH